MSVRATKFYLGLVGRWVGFCHLFACISVCVVVFGRPMPVYVHLYVQHLSIYELWSLVCVALFAVQLSV